MVAATPNVSFGYDAAGNRTSMTDGLGSMSYGYDQLSRLTSESRIFSNFGTYALTYAYNLAGEVTSITNPWGAQVGYNYDKIGRTSSVSGSGYAGVSSYVTSRAYRAFGLKQMSYANGRTLSVGYDNRMRPTSWSIPSVLRLQYSYTWEQSGRVEFVRNQDDETLDRWFAYDSVGRLIVSRSGNEARLAIGESVPLLYNGPYSHGYQYDQFGNMTYREGWGGDNPSYTVSYTNNKRAGLTYDAAGNVTNDGGQNFTYDATGQQTQAYYSGYLLQQDYDGNGRRVKKSENNAPTYYLRSSVLDGQVVAEINGSGTWVRGYVYLNGELLAVQQSGSVSWVHQDPLIKSKRITDGSGNVVSTIELDEWGANTSKSINLYFQPRRFGTYEQDQSGSDEAMFRRYNRWWSRFDQPDPYDGSYSLTNPQSFNRYAYVQNDPVNLTDPTGLMPNLCYGGGTETGGGPVCFGPYNPWPGYTPPDNPKIPTGGDPNPEPQPQPQPQDPRTACERMAADADRIAQQVKNEFPGASAAWTLQQFNQRYGQITFGSYFGEGVLGWLGTPTWSGRDVTANRDYRGDSGFPLVFQDSVDAGSDQVHHFGAYFSAGLADHKFASGVHEAGDRRQGNTGDVQLADQSYALGQYLRHNPTQLNNVGNLIRDAICDGKSVPK
jgi:RHS repeat-associated protein